MVFGDAGGSLCILDPMWEISITEFWAATVLVAIGNQEKNIDGETSLIWQPVFSSYATSCNVL